MVTLHNTKNKGLSPYLFTQFFKYASKAYTHEEVSEYFSLAKTPQEFHDFLAGCIYHGNFAACEYALSHHDYEQYKDNTDFKELVHQSLYQLAYELKQLNAITENTDAFSTDALIRSKSYLMK